MELVSVIIPAHNEEETLAKCLDFLLSQEEVSLEIIVVDDCSTDSTARILEKYPVVIVRNKQNLGLGGALNVGVNTSSSTFIMTLHADTQLVSSNWISKSLKHFNDSKVAAVGGKMLTSLPKDAGFFEHLFTLINFQNLQERRVGVEQVSFLETRCCIYRGEAIRRAGYFDELLGRNWAEDQDVSYKLRLLGYKLIRDNSLRASFGYGAHQNTFVKNLKKEYGYAKGLSLLFRRYGLFPLKGISNSGGFFTRALYRISKAFHIPALILALSIIPFNVSLGYLLLLSWLLLRLSIYSYMAFVGKRSMNNLSIVALPVLGLLTDFIYSFGFFVGALSELS